jgi:hypothetical protein
MMGNGISLPRGRVTRSVGPNPLPCYALLRIRPLAECQQKGLGRKLPLPPPPGPCGADHEKALLIMQVGDLPYLFSGGVVNANLRPYVSPGGGAGE